MIKSSNYISCNTKLPKRKRIYFSHKGESFFLIEETRITIGINIQENKSHSDHY